MNDITPPKEDSGSSEAVSPATQLALKLKSLHCHQIGKHYIQVPGRKMPEEQSAAPLMFSKAGVSARGSASVDSYCSLCNFQLYHHFQYQARLRCHTKGSILFLESYQVQVVIVHECVHREGLRHWPSIEFPAVCGNAIRVEAAEQSMNLLVIFKQDAERTL